MPVPLRSDFEALQLGTIARKTKYQRHAIVDLADQFVGVITAKVRIHSPEDRSFQFSQRPPIPNGLPSFMAIA
jgi:hypothetical protein